MSFKYEHARPALAVDIVVFGLAEAGPSLLVIKRGIEPYKDRWALPGGFVRIDETLDQAAHRELGEETGLQEVFLTQLSVFSELNRDPRERVVSVAYLAIVKSADFTLKAGTDAIDAKWIPLNHKSHQLAFDHIEIVKSARDWLIEQMYQQPIFLKVLPKAFTLTQMQALYEGILNDRLDKRNFRKRILGSGLLRKTNKKLINVAHRSAALYELKSKKSKEL